MTTNTVQRKGFLHPEMFRGLIEAAIFTNEEQLCEESESEYNHHPAYQGDWQLDRSTVSISDFADSSLAYLEDLCREFEASFPAFCVDADEYRITQLRDHTELEAVGHDLWMTITREGVGFWDGDWDKSMGDRLTAWCEQQSGLDLYFGDDRLIYIGGKENYAT